MSLLRSIGQQLALMSGGNGRDRRAEGRQVKAVVTVAALLLAGCQTPSSSQWCVGACTQVTPPAQQATIPPVKKEE